jgi:magnesium transporter
VPQVCQHTQEYFRDVYDHLLRVSQQLDGLRDMVVTALSVNLAMITLEDNKVTKRLASYGALIGVPTLIAGIYGMNFKAMPELEWIFGYPMALFFMALADVWIYRKLRKAQWI